MSRSSLKFLAILLSVLIVAVLFSGLDNLPRPVRAQIDSERRALAEAGRQLHSGSDEVAGEVASAPDLFRAIPSSREWPGVFAKDEAVLQSASRDMEQLSALEKRNRRQDGPRAQTLLAHERGLRTAALAGAAQAQRDAARWIEWKNHLPDDVAQMERDYQVVHAADLAPAAAAAQKAEADWPRKKSDLEGRLSAARALADGAEKAWQTSAESRRAAAANDLAHVDVTALAAAADALHTAAAELSKKSGEIGTLSAQLYNTWDKVLVDLEVRGIGSDKSYDEKIRTVTTQFAGATAKNGTTTSDEKWAEVSRPQFDALKNDLGMTVEHKPAGAYDSEAERTPQPAGFAYMAPLSQGSNQYGYWDHSGGGNFWVFYGQYALMRDLLFNHSYRSPDPREWDGYWSSRRSGQTYYGRDTASGGTRYGTQGSATQDRYSGSSYAKSGGFRDSQYASKSGGYRDSRFSTPLARDPEADHSPHRFGRNSGRPEEPRFTPPARTYRPSPAPRPSFRPSGPGRSFGRRR